MPLLCTAASLVESVVLADNVVFLWPTDKPASISVRAGSGEVVLCLGLGDTVGVMSKAAALLGSAWYPSARLASSRIKSFNTFHLRREGFFG